ncbi:MAG: GvpL/GvpF family gas vesicle protein [Bacillota bacterium]
MNESLLYLYAIGGGEFIPPPAEPLREVFTVCYDGLTAFVAPVPVGEHEVSREAMISHQKVVGALWSMTPVVPVSFGTVLRDRTEVERLLEMNREELEAALKRLIGRIELGLKVFWKKEVFAARFGERDPAVAELIRKAQESGSERSYPVMAKVGELVEAKVQEARSLFEREVHRVLAGSAEDAVLNEILTIRMVLNAAYLVSKEDELLFDQQVNQLLEPRLGEFDVRYTGPWPPYNFARLRLKLQSER